MILLLNNYLIKNNIDLEVVKNKIELKFWIKMIWKFVSGKLELKYFKVFVLFRQSKVMLINFGV